MSDDDPAAALAAYAAALADGVESTIASWVVRCVAQIMTAWAGGVPPDVAVAAEAAGVRAAAEVAPALREMLGRDIDEQTTTPLALVRAALRYPTAVLRSAGVPPVERDAFSEASFPDDDYDLAPASFSDLDPALGEVAVRWGAAKAFEHKRRHR